MDVQMITAMFILPDPLSILCYWKITRLLATITDP